MSRRAFAVGLALALGLAPAAVSAHRLAPSLLQLVESGEPGHVAVTWKTPLQRPVGSDVRPALPEHCAPVGQPSAEAEGTGMVVRSRIDCGTAGLVGATLAVHGLDAGGANALVRVELRDGRRAQAVLHAGASAFTVPERESVRDVVWGYLRLGVEHILSGLDHLVFVLGLIWLVTGARALVGTVTAFTLGHSVTLSLAALGFVRFPSALVEIVIAATILVLALELARPDAAERPGILRRWPWAVAFGFGLLHGLGFAGALAEIGLPQGEIPLALLSFNLGIEAGQLAFVGVVLGLRAGLRTLPPLPRWLQQAPVHAIGGLAVYWCLDRVVSLFA